MTSITPATSSAPDATRPSPVLLSIIYGSTGWSQLCLLSHHTTTTLMTTRTMQNRIINPQMSDRRLFRRSRSSHESGSLLRRLVRHQNGERDMSQRTFLTVELDHHFHPVLPLLDGRPWRSASRNRDRGREPWSDGWENIRRLQTRRRRRIG